MQSSEIKEIKERLRELEKQVAFIYGVIKSNSDPDNIDLAEEEIKLKKKEIVLERKHVIIGIATVAVSIVGTGINLIVNFLL